MIITPMPDMNPEITEYGVKATKRPILSTPSRICISPGHNHDGKRLGQVVGVGSDDNRHSHGHRAGRPGYLRPDSPEHRREKPHRYGALYAGNCPQPRGNPESQRHWQPDHRGGHTSEEVPS